MENSYLNNLKVDSLLKLKDLDFRSKEGYEIKKRIGINSSKVIKQRIRELLKQKKDIDYVRTCFYLESNYISKIIKIQSLVRKYAIMSKLKYFGPSFFNRKESNNSFDFFSYQDIHTIPSEYLFSYRDQDKFIYTFDIRSLEKLFCSNSFENPFNRESFSNEIKELIIVRINSYRKETEFISPESKSLNKKKRKISLPDEISHIKTRAVDLFQKMDQLDQYTNVSWFCDLNLKQLKNFYRFLEDIWNYRTQITQDQKRKISKDGDVCAIPINTIMKIKKINELQTIILDQMELLITGGETKDEQILGCLYILTALAETSPKIAECLPWLVNS